MSTPAGEERTYDLEIAGTHNFVANDIIVHNSHSVAYSVVAYHTAWLKTHYPAEFMAALLSSQIGKTEEVIKYIAEAREMGLEVLPPDVNESGWRFTVVGDKRIRFGLGAIRNVGRGAIDSLLAAREAGPFESLYDLCARVDLRMCNKRVFEALIGAGACDALGRTPGPAAGRRSTRPSDEASLQQDEAERRAGVALRRSRLGRPADQRTPRLARATLPNDRRVERKGAAAAREGRCWASIFRGTHSSPSEQSASCSPRTRWPSLGDWTDQSVDDRGGGHRHQEAVLEKVGRRVRPVDSRGFFRIFRGAGLSGSVGRDCRAGPAGYPPAHQGRLLRARIRT
ncbi:MAG: hypothetical protein U5K74_05990 [Gemmatimonadaceae bacterium]|nr:hypothetical protein [Gemmatimonadaceae bacterium]